MTPTDERGMSALNASGWIAGPCLVFDAFGGNESRAESILWSICEFPSITPTAQNQLHLKCHAENRCKPHRNPLI